MLLRWQKRGLQCTILATASYTSKNGHISTMSHQFCEAFSAKQVQDQGDPAARVFISFLKTTISWIMTGHVA